MPRTLHFDAQTAGRVRSPSNRVSSFTMGQELRLNTADPLWPAQKLLWNTIGLKESVSGAEWLQTDLDTTCLAAARVICLQTAELQQLLCAEDIQRPLNPRNEAASLALLLANSQRVCGSSAERQQQLQDLLCSYAAQGNTSTPTHDASQQQPQQQQQLQGVQQLPQSFPQESLEAQLHRWAVQQGATSQLTPALSPYATSNSSSSSSSSGSSSEEPSPPSGLRGCAAAADIQAGSVVMGVPAKLLITYSTAAESDFGKALGRLPGLDAETLAVIWTMVDRHEPESPHAPFWSALPPHFGTGLSAPQPLVELLKGVPLYQECAEARAHVRQQFEALQQTFKVLLTAYGSYLQPSWFTEEAYLWAVDLWYAYSIQVKFPDGTIQPALVPLASLINHSATPHIVHFSTVNPKTRCLELKCFRPIPQHQQAFLSYGPLPNSQLLLFYGFALTGNPFEQQQLQVQPDRVLQLLQAEQQQQDVEQQQQLAGKVKLLQELQLPATFTLTVQQPLPQGLLPSLRLLCASRTELQGLQEALQQYKQRVAASSAAAAAPAPGGSSKAGRKGKPKAAAAGGPSDGNAEVSAEAVLQRWAAVAQQEGVLGVPISSSNEAAAHAVLGQLLAAARQPYEACLAKLHKRQQLQAMLQGQGKQVQQPAEAGFLSVLEVYLQDVLPLFDTCSSAAAQGHD